MEPIVFDIEALNLNTILPMLITLAGALLILILDLVKKQDKGLYVALSTLFIAADLYLVIAINEAGRGFFDVLLVDGIAVISQVIILVASLLFIPLALTGHRFKEFQFAEHFAFFLFMIAGFQFMVASDNLILIFIGLETASLALYALIAMHNRQKSLEAAIKYFTMGAFAAGFFAFGSLMFYGLTGSIELGTIKEVLEANGYENQLIILMGAVFMIVALGFKLSIVPFHSWTPDVYEGASAPLAGYMSIVPKIAGFVVAIRLFDALAASAEGTVVYTLLWISAVATMTIGNIIALVQDGVKRMLAYSSISHSGFVLTAIVIGGTQATSGLFIYWGLFLFTNLGAFAMLWISRHPSKQWDIRYNHPFTKFSGMIKHSPLAAIIMAIFMLSLAGIPPLALYWGKIYMIGAAINSDHLYLAIIMTLNSGIAIYYYLKLIVYMFLKDSVDNDGTVYFQNETIPLKLILGFAATVVVFSIFGVDPLITSVTSSIAASGF
jgi:NADH-quinone oxidoreductase subunit N